jgi:NADH-quinone oxidoreductase subunit A
LYNPLPVLKTYLPVLVFLFLGLLVRGVFVQMNKILGPKKPGQVKREPYECGLPSEVTKNFRFGVSFYLVAMLFIGFIYVWRRGALEWN